jgi:hypothetical protein
VFAAPEELLAILTIPSVWATAFGFVYWCVVNIYTDGALAAQKPPMYN